MLRRLATERAAVDRRQFEVCVLGLIVSSLVMVKINLFMVNWWLLVLILHLWLEILTEHVKLFHYVIDF